MLWHVLVSQDLLHEKKISQEDFPIIANLKVDK